MNLNPKHYPLFHGWWVVGACCLIALYTGGVVFFGFTAIFEPIANEFRWSYTQISFASSLRGLEVGLLSPLLGSLADRWGPRRIIFGGAIIIGLGLMLLSRITSLGMFYVAFVIIAIGASALSGTVLLTAVSNWFHKKMALAIGIVASGFALGGLMIPLVTVLVDIFEWRTTMVILGLGAWGITLPLSLLVRSKPEQYGYLPDGEASNAVAIDEGLASTQSIKADIQVSKAPLRSAFWHVALASICHMLMVGAVVTHVMPYLNSIGITRSASSLMASAIPLASIGGRLSFGWFGERLDKRRLSAVGFALMALGLLLFGYVATGWMWVFILFIITFGVGWGGNVVMRATLLREYFGRSRFGTIYGFVAGIAMLGQLAGPPLAGWVFDKWGAYQGIWFALAGLAVAALVIMLTIPSSHSRI